MKNKLQGHKYKLADMADNRHLIIIGKFWKDRQPTDLFTCYSYTDDQRDYLNDGQYTLTQLIAK